MTKASIDSYIKLLDEKQQHRRKCAVAKLIHENYGITSEVLCERLSHKFRNDLVYSGISELLDEGFIKVIGQFPSSTTNRDVSQFAFVTDHDEIMRLRKEREKDKARKAIKNLVKKFNDFLPQSIVSQLETVKL